MNVFIVGSPLETARALDKKRLNKQIIECQQILDALDGKKAWSNHPCTIQYREHRTWLVLYMACLNYYRRGNYFMADFTSQVLEDAKSEAPHFHTEEFFTQIKRRLYTKDPIHYAQWADLGTSEENWYWSPTEEKIIKYVNGKRQD